MLDFAYFSSFFSLSSPRPSYWIGSIFFMSSFYFYFMTLNQAWKLIRQYIFVKKGLTVSLPPEPTLRRKF